MPSAAVTVTTTVFSPATRAVPETAIVASGSTATAFTEAKAVRAGNTIAP